MRAFGGEKAKAHVLQEKTVKEPKLATMGVQA